MARSLLDLFRLRREQSRLRKKQLQRQVAYSLQNKLRGPFNNLRSESLEPRNLLAAVPIALDDFAYFTNSGTDLVVSGSSNHWTAMLQRFASLLEPDCWRGRI
jgi:hypothetical protein